MADAYAYLYFGVKVPATFDAANQEYVLASGIKLSHEPESPVPGAAGRGPDLETICFHSVCDSRGDPLPEIIVGFFLGGGAGIFSPIPDELIALASAKRPDICDKLKTLGLECGSEDVKFYVFGYPDV